MNSVQGSMLWTYLEEVHFLWIDQGNRQGQIEKRFSATTSHIGANRSAVDRLPNRLRALGNLGPDKRLAKWK